MITNEDGDSNADTPTAADDNDEDDITTTIMRLWCCKVDDDGIAAAAAEYNAADNASDEGNGDKDAGVYYAEEE